MTAAQLAGRANEFMRRHRRLHSAAAHLSAPVRRTAVPVLFGNGRGLRVRTGPSTMMRLVSVVEADVEKTLLDLLGPGDVAYDIGANIGWFSLLAARKVGPSGGVIAFEPSLANVEFLRRNAASNRLDNLTILPTAVGDRDGWASFAEDSSLKGRLSEGGSQCVPLLSLDSWLEEVDLRPPQVVKIDVEGAVVDPRPRPGVRPRFVPSRCASNTTSTCPSRGASQTGSRSSSTATPPPCLGVTTRSR